MKCLCGEEMWIVVREKESVITGCPQCLRVVFVTEESNIWYMLEKVERTNKEVKREVGAYEKGEGNKK